jgi:hypothetical protein
MLIIIIWQQDKEISIVKEHHWAPQENTRKVYDIVRFSLDIGKYILLTQDGNEHIINKIGTFTPKFRKYFTGFASAKNREEIGRKDNTALHFTPVSTYRLGSSSFSPMTEKFIGYNQQPYQIKDKKIP